MASKYGSLTPYNYSLNSPSNKNDPLGDDVEPVPPAPREIFCGYCGRSGEDMEKFMRATGGNGSGSSGGWGGTLGGGYYGGSGPMGNYWHPGDSRYFWSGYEQGARAYRHDQDMVRNNDMSKYDFYSKHPGYISYGGGAQAFAAVLNDFGYRFVKKQSAEDRISLPSLEIALVTLPIRNVEGPNGRTRIFIAGNEIIVNGRNLNPDRKVIANQRLKEGIAGLYASLVSKLGTSDFQFKVTGGDRYQRSYHFPGVDGRIRLTFSRTDGSFMPTSGPDHISGIAADLRIKFNDNTLVPVDLVRPLLEGAGLMFDEGAMPSDYKDRHYHLVLQN